MRIATKWISVHVLVLAFVITCCLGVEDKMLSAGEKEHNSCPLRQFGQFSAWSEPVNLGLVNSAFRNLHPAISANGLSLYISSDRPGGPGGVDIWVSQRASLDDAWGPPQVLGPNINTKYNDGAPNFSFDGHWMYFHSNRPEGCGKADLYVSHREDTADDFAWGPAQDLGCMINSPEFNNGPTYFRDDETGTVTMYFNSTRPGGIGEGPHIYASTLGDDGTFGPAVLVPELSSDKFEGSIGTQDLWVSTRTTTSDAWSTPVNLGPPINSGFEEGGPALSCDGTTLYFYSTRPGGFGGMDLYVTTRTELCNDEDDNENNGRHHACKKHDD